MQKRGQGMQTEVIVAIALALVVLGGLLYAYLSAYGKFRGASQSCEANGGRCVSGTSPTVCAEHNARPYQQYTCTEQFTCCLEN
ncbi:MAG: hypothetical protein HY363_04490 [Candidatus Aenigmarchaeota archaeon]|nr:hypothetical protein [Candidatus Aenigmarchaeota archaeon]